MALLLNLIILVKLTYRMYVVRGEFNFQLDIECSLSEAGMITINALYQRLPIACKFYWYKVVDNEKIAIENAGNIYQCSVFDIGYKIETQIESHEDECEGKAIIEFNIITMSPQLEEKLISVYHYNMKIPIQVNDQPWMMNLEQVDKQDKPIYFKDQIINQTQNGCILDGKQLKFKSKEERDLFVALFVTAISLKRIHLKFISNNIGRFKQKSVNFQSVLNSQLQQMIKSQQMVKSQMIESNIVQQNMKSQHFDQNQLLTYQNQISLLQNDVNALQQQNTYLKRENEDLRKLSLNSSGTSRDQIESRDKKIISLQQELQSLNDQIRDLRQQNQRVGLIASQEKTNFFEEVNQIKKFENEKQQIIDDCNQKIIKIQQKYQQEINSQTETIKRLQLDLDSMRHNSRMSMSQMSMIDDGFGINKQLEQENEYLRKKIQILEQELEKRKNTRSNSKNVGIDKDQYLKLQETNKRYAEENLNLMQELQAIKERMEFRSIDQTIRDSQIVETGLYSQLQQQLAFQKEKYEREIQSLQQKNQILMDQIKVFTQQKKEYEMRQREQQDNITRLVEENQKYFAELKEVREQQDLLNQTLSQTQVMDTPYFQELEHQNKQMQQKYGFEIKELNRKIEKLKEEVQDQQYLKKQIEQLKKDKQDINRKFLEENQMLREQLQIAQENAPSVNQSMRESQIYETPSYLLIQQQYQELKSSSQQEIIQLRQKLTKITDENQSLNSQKKQLEINNKQLSDSNKRQQDETKELREQIKLLKENQYNIKDSMVQDSKPYQQIEQKFLELQQRFNIEISVLEKQIRNQNDEIQNMQGLQKLIETLKKTNQDFKLKNIEDNQKHFDEIKKLREQLIPKSLDETQILYSNQYQILEQQFQDLQFKYKQDISQEKQKQEKIRLEFQDQAQQLKRQFEEYKRQSSEKIQRYTEQNQRLFDELEEIKNNKHENLPINLSFRESQILDTTAYQQLEQQYQETKSKHQLEVEQFRQKVSQQQRDLQDLQNLKKKLEFQEQLNKNIQSENKQLQQELIALKISQTNHVAPRDSQIIQSSVYLNMEQQMNQIKIKYEKDIRSLENEIYTLQLTLKDVEQQKQQSELRNTEKFMKENLRLQDEINYLNNRSINYGDSQLIDSELFKKQQQQHQAEVKQYITQINNLNKEIQQLELIIKQQDIEINNRQNMPQEIIIEQFQPKQIMQQQIELKAEIPDFNNDYIEQLEQQLSKMKESNKFYLDENQRLYEELKAVNQKLMGQRLQSQSESSQDLKQQIILLQGELEKYKQRYFQTEQQYQDVTKFIEQFKQNQQESSQRMMDENYKLLEENRILRDRLDNPSGNISLRESQILQTSTYRRIEGQADYQLKQKEQDIQNLKQLINNQQRLLDEYQQQIKESKSQYQDTQQQLQQQVKSKQPSQKQEELQQIISQLGIENKNIQEVHNSIKNRLEQKINKLNEENSELQHQYSIKESQCQNLAQQLQQKEKELVKYTTLYSEFQKQMPNLQDDTRVLRQNLHNSELKIKEQEQIIQFQQQQLKQKDDDQRKLSLQLDLSQKQIIQIQDQYSQDIKSLQQQQENEIKQVTQRINLQLNNENSKFNQVQMLEQQILQLSNQNALLTQQIFEQEKRRQSLLSESFTSNRDSFFDSKRGENEIIKAYEQNISDLQSNILQYQDKIKNFENKQLKLLEQIQQLQDDKIQQQRIYTDKLFQIRNQYDNESKSVVSQQQQSFEQKTIKDLQQQLDQFKLNETLKLTGHDVQNRINQYISQLQQYEVLTKNLQNDVAKRDQQIIELKKQIQIAYQEKDELVFRHQEQINQINLQFQELKEKTEQRFSSRQSRDTDRNDGLNSSKVNEQAQMWIELTKQKEQEIIQLKDELQRMHSSSASPSKIIKDYELKYQQQSQEYQKIIIGLEQREQHLKQQMIAQFQQFQESQESDTNKLQILEKQLFTARNQNANLLELINKLEEQNKQNNLDQSFSSIRSSMSFQSKQV
ncbi:hypothetical protein pb186bvf_012742 [Paramecium bursaria]